MSFNLILGYVDDIVHSGKSNVLAHSNIIETCCSLGNFLIPLLPSGNFIFIVQISELFELELELSFSILFNNFIAFSFSCLILFSLSSFSCCMALWMLAWSAWSAFLVMSFWMVCSYSRFCWSRNLSLSMRRRASCFSLDNGGEDA